MRQLPCIVSRRRDRGRAQRGGKLEDATMMDLKKEGATNQGVW